MIPILSSPSNPKIKDAAKLRDGNYRRRTGRFLIDGLREIQRAADSGIKFLEIFCDAGFYDKGQADLFHNPIFDSSAQPDAQVYLVSRQAFDKIAFGNRNEGLVIVAQMPDRSLEFFEQKITNKKTQSLNCPLFAVLENIEKPGNVGAVFRSADGAGLDGVLIADRSADLFNPNMIRGSLGTLFRLPSATVDPEPLLTWLRSRKINIAAARCEGAIPYTDYDFRQPTAIVLGSEAEGLTELWTGKDITAISLPMHGIADSLNVSNAAAVLFYEARRQRAC